MITVIQNDAASADKELNPALLMLACTLQMETDQ